MSVSRAGEEEEEALRRTASVQRHFRRLSMMLHQTADDSTGSGKPLREGAGSSSSSPSGFRTSSGLHTASSEASIASVNLLTPVASPSVRSRRFEASGSHARKPALPHTPRASGLREIFDLCATQGNSNSGRKSLNATQFREAILALRPSIDAQTTDDVFYSVSGLTGNETMSWEDFKKVYEGQFDEPNATTALHSQESIQHAAAPEPSSTSSSLSLPNGLESSEAHVKSNENSPAIVSELRRHIARLEHQLVDEQQARGALAADLSNLRDQHLALEDRAEVVQTMEAQIHELKAEMQGDKQRISDERMSRTVAERETREAEAQREAAMESCADLQQQLSNAITLLEQSNQDRESALSDKKALQVQLQSQQEALHKSALANERVETRAKELQQEFDRMKIAYARSAHEAETHASTSSAAKTSLEEAQQRLKVMAEQLSKEQEARLTAEQRYETVNKENSTLREDILRAEETSRMAKLRAEDAKDELSKYEAKIFSSGKTIKRLEGELARERQKKASSEASPSPLSDHYATQVATNSKAANSAAYENTLLVESHAEIERLRAELESAKRDCVSQREEISRQGSAAREKSQDLQQQLDEIMMAYEHDQRKWSAEKGVFDLEKTQLIGQLETAKNSASALSDEAEAIRGRLQALEIEKRNVEDTMERLKAKSERELSRAKQEHTDMQAEADAAASRLHKSISVLQSRVKECEKHAEEEKRIFTQNLRDAQNMRARAETLLSSHVAEQKIALHEQAGKFMAEARQSEQQHNEDMRRCEIKFRAKEQEVIDAAEKRYEELRLDFEGKAKELHSKCDRESMRADKAEKMVDDVKKDAAQRLRIAQADALEQTSKRVDEVNESFKNEVARLRKATREAESAARDAQAAQESETMSLAQSLRLLRENVAQADRRANQLQSELSRRKNEEERAISAVMDEKERLEADISRFKSQLTEAREEKHDLQSRLDQLSETLKTKSSECSHLESKMRRSSEEIIRLEASVSEAIAARETAETMASASEARQKLAETHWEEEKKIMNDRFGSEISDLQRRITYLQESLEQASVDSSKREEKHQKELDSVRQKVEERERRVASSERQRLEADAERLEAKVREQHKKEESLRESFDAKESELLDKLETSKAAMRKVKLLAREELRGLAEMVRSSNAREITSSEALQECQKRLSEIEQQNEALLVDIQQRKANEESQKAGIDAMRTTHVAVEARLDHATKNMESLVAKLATAKASAESEASRAQTVAAELNAVKHSAEMNEKRLKTQIKVLETRHAEIESKLNEAQRKAALLESEKANPRESADVTRLRLANMRAEAKIVSLSDDLNAATANYAEKEEHITREMKAQRQAVRRLEGDHHALLREREKCMTLKHELEKTRNTLRKAKESHDQVRHENVILASEAERIVERMANQQLLEKEELQRNFEEAQEELRRTRAELQQLKSTRGVSKAVEWELNAALRASQEETAKARAEAEHAILEHEKEALQVSEEAVHVQELEAALNQSQHVNQRLESTIHRMGNDKTRLEHSIQEREQLNRRVNQELNGIRNDFHSFLHDTKMYSKRLVNSKTYDVTSSETYGINSIDTSPAVPEETTNKRLTASDLKGARVPEINAEEGSVTKIEVSRRGSIHIHRSGRDETR